MLKAMDNVALVMVVAHEVLKDESSQWAPYLNILPNNFTTPIFYSLEQLQVADVCFIVLIGGLHKDIYSIDFANGNLK